VSEDTWKSASMQCRYDGVSLRNAASKMSNLRLSTKDEIYLCRFCSLTTIRAGFAQ